MLRCGRALLAVGLLVAAASGCGPKYPACEKDEDCNKEKPRGEFCVNQKCQQCRNDKDCGPGKRCNGGRCDAIPNYCKDDTGCPADQACVNHKCQACAADDQCGEGGKCKKGKCFRKGTCSVDDDCPVDQDCVKGVCTGAPQKASQDAACKLQPIYFDFNESALSTEAADLIDKNYACIKRVGRPVQIIGRSDERGTEEYNLALSERRAQMVRDRLQSLGADGGKMRTLPKGELEATGRDEAGWANDRRVDFEWM
jgi:peptidoglycan-associated lipoprotein